MRAHRSEYDDVPDAADVREVDPHWQELQVTGPLPTSYLPATMPGPQPRWRRTAAWVLIGLLTTVTAGGVCLTYGPAELFRLLDGRP
jgi:hypothetical protein